MRTNIKKEYCFDKSDNSNRMTFKQHSASDFEEEKLLMLPMSKNNSCPTDDSELSDRFIP